MDNTWKVEKDLGLNLRHNEDVSSLCKDGTSAVTYIDFILEEATVWT